MGPDINQNTNYFNFAADGPRVAGTLARLGASNAARLGDFKLVASHWSPAPWVKISSGNTISGQSGILPVNGTPGRSSGAAISPAANSTTIRHRLRAEFGRFRPWAGTGPTSALTQFARCTPLICAAFRMPTMFASMPSASRTNLTSRSFTTVARIRSHRIISSRSKRFAPSWTNIPTSRRFSSWAGRFAWRRCLRDVAVWRREFSHSQEPAVSGKTSLRIRRPRR